MSAERIAMRRVRDVLWLNAAGVSGNEIARRGGVAPSTVRLTLKRLAAAGLGWPLPAAMTNVAVARKLAVIMHRMWVTGGEFEFGSPAAAATAA